MHLVSGNELEIPTQGSLQLEWLFIAYYFAIKAVLPASSCDMFIVPLHWGALLASASSVRVSPTHQEIFRLQTQISSQGLVINIHSRSQSNSIHSYRAHQYSPFPCVKGFGVFFFISLILSQAPDHIPLCQGSSSSVVFKHQIKSFQSFISKLIF